MLAKIWGDRAVYLVGLGHGATHWIAALFYFVLPFMAKDLGLSYMEAGMFASIFSIASLCANLFSGPLVDITGKRVMWQALSLAIGTLALFLMGSAGLYIVVAALMVLIGASNNLWHPAAISYLSAGYPERRGFALSIHALGANIGDALAPLLMAPVLAVMSWRETVELGSIVPIGVIFLLLVFVPRTGKKGSPSKQDSLGVGEYFKGVGSLLKDRAVLILCFMSGFRNMAQTGLLVFLPLYLANEMKLSPFMMGVALFAFQSAGIIAAPIAGIWSDKIGRRPLVMAGLGITTVMIILLSFVDNPTIYVAGISVMGFGLFAIRPVVHSWLMDMTPPHMGGSATSLLFAIQSAMTVFAPLIGGALADRYGLISAFYFLGGTLLVANFLVFFLPKKAAEA